MALPDDFKEQLLAKVKSRMKETDCELCRENNWSVLDTAIALNLTDLTGAFRMPPHQIPAGALICNNCGNVRLFALGVLDLLPKGKQGASNDES